jgi:eukaryotic-like serine/threonine-protein kinase
MTSDRWEKVAQIFHAVSERPAHERAALLDETCAGDEELRREVEELIASDSAAEQLENITPHLAAGLLAEDDQQHRVGCVLGRYRVLSAIGSGGMGEVYLAEDTTLGRKVALKLLPRAFTEHEDRVRRFAQEARAASGLNHPNILTIHEIGQADGEHFIAMEFVDGETLRQRLQRGRLNLDEALKIGTQAAGALSAAHAAGIVHRDIKPDNIMLRRDGYIKVLDFGLAKLVNHSRPLDHSATQAGRVMGTVHYMSPEQALGQPLDHRTDIFSLGVVLYELATGARPFEGKTEAAVYDAILNKTPASIIGSQSLVPAELDGIVRRALEKDRALRYPDAAQLRADLTRLERDTGTKDIYIKSTAASSARRSPTKVLLAAGAMAVVIAGYTLWRQLPRPAQKTQPLVPANFVRLTEGRGLEEFPSFAPDGKSFVYASAASGNWDIDLQRVGGSNAINLTKDSLAEDTQPAFSPDGEYIAFRSERDGGGIFVTGATGENTRRLSDFGYNPSWSPDGKEIVCASEGVASPRVRFTAASELWAINVATGVKRLIPSNDAVQPSWSPHGRRIAYWGIAKGKRGIATVSIHGGDIVQVTPGTSVDWNPVWSPDGAYLYYASDRGGSMNLWRIAIDETTGKVRSEPESIIVPASGIAHLCLSQSGRRMLYVQTDSKNNLQKIGFDPSTGKVTGQPSPVTQGSLQTTDPAFSPDGQSIAFSTSGESQEDIFVCRSDGSDRRQLTNDVFQDRLPRWSRDGRQLAFMSNRSGNWEVWLINADGSGLRQLTFTSAAGVFLPTWSPDGSRLAYSKLNGNARILQLDLPWSEQSPTEFGPDATAGEWFNVWSWSPDGSTLAGTRQSARRSGGIRLCSIDSRQLETISEKGFFPVWLNDGFRLLFYERGILYLADRRTKEISEVLNAAPYEIDRFDLSRDNRVISYSLTTREADIWMATLQ